MQNKLVALGGTFGIKSLQLVDCLDLGRIKNLPQSISYQVNKKVLPR